MSRGARGQAAMETVITIVVVVTALIAMGIYAQRAIQGNLSSGTASIGQQFDPRDAWSERHGMNSTDTVQQEVVIGTVGAYLLDGWLPDRSEQQEKLVNLPAGPIHREPSQARSAVTSTWNATEDIDYCNDRGGGCP